MLQNLGGRLNISFGLSNCDEGFEELILCQPCVVLVDQVALVSIYR